MRMRGRLFNLWTPPSCRTSTMTTSDSPFMEDYSSEDYDDDYDYDVVPSNDQIMIHREGSKLYPMHHKAKEYTFLVIIECNEVIAPEVPSAVGTKEGEEVEVPVVTSLPLSITMVKTSWDPATTVPPFYQCPEYLSVEMFLSSAALFVLQECCFLSQLERLRTEFCSALRTLIRKPFVWASHKYD